MHNYKVTGGCRLPGNVQAVESTLQLARFLRMGGGFDHLSERCDDHLQPYTVSYSIGDGW